MPPPRTLDTPTWSFVPADFDATDVPAVETLFAALEERPIPDAAALGQWLRDESELTSRLGAGVARRYVRMTCHTADEQAREDYLHMQREVVPRAKVLGDRLDRKLLDDPHVDELDERYQVLLRSRRAAREIFREENTELHKQESEIRTRQQELMGSITVGFEGREHTLQQLGPYYEDQDRDLRRRAYTASVAARRPHWDELEEIFDRLVTLRDRMGRNAGFEGYTPFRFVELDRFDYGPEHCRRFHEAVAATVVPAVGELDRVRRERLGLDSLRPWDLEVDPEGRPPFRPFTTQDELVALARRVFARVDPRFNTEFAILEERDLLDLMSRTGKAPGGYQYNLEDERLPFIFANSVGLHGDVQTLLHEGGHAFHSILSRHFDLHAYRHSPIEFAETASMSMELMGLEELAGVYAADEARAVRRRHLEGVLRILPWIASIDAFQHRVYARPTASLEERRDAWLAIRDRMAPDIDYSGFEDARAHQWTGQGHLYQHAFYYIEYGIAQLAALQVWRDYRRDPRATVERYRKALSLGGSRPLPELFDACGVRFDFGPELMGELVDDVMEQIRG